VRQQRDGDGAGVMRIGDQIDFGEALLVIDEIGNGARTRAEHPALLAHQRLDHGKRNRVLEPLELAEDHGALRPRAGERNVEVITARLGRKAAPAGGARTAVRAGPAAARRGGGPSWGTWGVCARTGRSASRDPGAARLRRSLAPWPNSPGHGRTRQAALGNARASPRGEPIYSIK